MQFVSYPIYGYRALQLAVCYELAGCSTQATRSCRNGMPTKFVKASGSPAACPSWTRSGNGVSGNLRAFDLAG